ncbi:hypothetical protein [Pararhodonellum marinum]|uniref:hypothetical protein n=1 Tax=Pararhodonellum marinum TaxID=2755358 RepID=UPI00188F9F1E|nr:hypothetical protein [Pararhodonellum marinum]
MKKTLNSWPLVVILCLTLGLAPFSPEPHVWGKLKWIAGGANGMAVIDWLDFFFHGLPWVLLVRLIVVSFRKSNKKGEHLKVKGTRLGNF